MSYGIRHRCKQCQHTAVSAINQVLESKKFATYAKSLKKCPKCGALMEVKKI